VTGRAGGGKSIKKKRARKGRKDHRNSNFRGEKGGKRIPSVSQKKKKFTQGITPGGRKIIRVSHNVHG